MKRKKYFYIFTILIIAISILMFLISLNNKNLSNKVENYDIEIFVPDGLADKYKNLNSLSFNSWEIYEYKLNDNEIQAIEKELDNGYWAKFDGEDKEYFLRDYFYPLKLNKVLGCKV